MPIISVQSLSKSFRVPRRSKGFWARVATLVHREYDTALALDNISFDIDEGELVGYIGPNGAGKSTTVKILSGILVPSRGQIAVLGKNPWKHRLETVRQIGVVFGQRTQLRWDLPVIESLEFLKAIYRLSDSAYRQTLDELTLKLDLSDLLNVPVRLLSLGQRMRCDLAASLLHRPRILFLDEPTIGLDAVSKLAVRDFIRHLNREQKVTVLLTTHDMDDIEALCPRVLLLSAGALFFDGTLSALRQKVLPERRLVVDLLQEHDTIRDPHVEFIRQEGHRVWLRFNPALTPTPEIITRITAEHAVTDLFIENPPIEELIVKLYRDANR